jgi:hypothetical protein
MNGWQLADAAGFGRPDRKNLFITGYPGNAVLSDGHLEPGMHMLTKPFTMESPANRIRKPIPAWEVADRMQDPLHRVHQLSWGERLDQDA